MKVKGIILGAVVLLILAVVPFIFKIDAAAKKDVQNSELSVTKQVEIGDFDKVEVSQGIKLILTQRENNGEAAVQTTPEMEPLLRVETEGNTLKIYYATKNEVKSTECNSTIVKANTMTLKEIEASSAAIVNLACNFILENELEIETSSASKVRGRKVTCPKLELSSSSASGIEIEEVAGNLDVETSSAASIAVKSVKGKELEAEASSASSIGIEKVYCENVKAEASSTAHVSLAGMCGSFKKETSSGGRISCSKLAVRKSASANE